jgi:hypothetical protein
VRPLLYGLPGRVEALERQKANLHRFVREHEQEYAALPYHPWTQQQSGLGVAVDVAASTLPGGHGLRGVLLRDSVSTRGEKVPLLHYPGLLVTDALFSTFVQDYYCPTALGLPALKWKDPATGEVIRFLIIGDPTSKGAIINDGPVSGRPGQPHRCTRATASERFILSVAYLLSNLCLCFVCRCAQPTAPSNR